MSDVYRAVEAAKEDVIRLKRAAKGWSDSPPTGVLLTTLRSVRQASDLIARRHNRMSPEATCAHLSSVVEMQSEVMMSLVTLLGDHAVGFD